MACAGCWAACQTTDRKAGQALTEEERNKAANDSANFTTLQWLDSTVLDMGKVKEGAVVDISYRFRNTGDKSLIIERVDAPCGCTVPEKPEQPFAPGEEGVIKAKFNSNGRVGPNNKMITVTANTTPVKEHPLHFNVEVTN